MKGMRLRFSSATIKDFISALGGTPVGLPPTQIVESMQKGTIDGALIDYGGAGIAFKIGPVTKYTTEMYSYVTSFCICMNQRSFDRLPANLQEDDRRTPSSASKSRSATPGTSSTTPARQIMMKARHDADQAVQGARRQVPRRRRKGRRRQGRRADKKGLPASDGLQDDEGTGGEERKNLAQSSGPSRPLDQLSTSAARGEAVRSRRRCRF